MREEKVFHVPLTQSLKKKILAWAQQFSEVIWMDSNEYPQQYHSYEAILAVDAFTAIKTDAFRAFEKLQEYQTHPP